MTPTLQDLPKGPFTDLFKYWQGLRVGDGTPAVSSFDLLALPHLVTNVTIFEFRKERIRIRFVGTDIITETGEDTTGQYLDEMPNMSAVQDRSIQCARTAEPYFQSGLPVTWTSRDYKTYSTLGLPLGDEAGPVSQIVFLMIFG